GWWALKTTPIDAIPDLSDNQVIVFSEWQGHAAQGVEDQITYPMTGGLQGLAGVRVVRSQSAFGFSMGYVVFEDDIALCFSRACVGAHEPAHEVAAGGRHDDTRAGCHRSRSRAVVHRRKSLAVAPRPSDSAGLVHSLPTERCARGCGSRLRRRVRSAIPDRPR